MTGTCVEKLPHSCGSRDGLQVFEENKKYTGFCFKCKTYVENPYNGDEPPNPPKKKKDPVAFAQQHAEIQTLPFVDLPDRFLSKETLEYFGVHVGLSEADGSTPELHYYPLTRNGDVVSYHIRYVPQKKFWFIGDSSEADLFGWEQAIQTNAKRLFITEGYTDAMALYQALRDKNQSGKWAHLHPAVVSLTRGAGGVKKDLTTHFKQIRHYFKEIVLVFDMDEAGAVATKEALQIFPDAKSAQLPCKDANACLMEGRAIALCNSVLFRAETPKNTRLVWGNSLFAEARTPPKWGLSWPWEGMTNMTRGLRFGETTYIGAGVKMGKSEIVNSLAAHLMTVHNMKVFLAKPEEANRKTVKMVLGKVAGKFFHDPTVPFDYEAYDAAAEKVGDKLCMLSLYQHMGWDTLRSDIIAAAANGCKAVFIDPITNLVNGISSGETNTILQEVSQELAALAKDLDILAFVFCHLKAPTSGDPHERGGLVMSHQFAGSRAMMRSCNYMIGLEGNKDPDLPKAIQNTRRLVMLEDREFGESGFIKLHWSPETSLFTEIKEEEEENGKRRFKRTEVQAD